MYAGINVEGTGLVSEGSSKDREKFSQTQHRFKKYTIFHFEKNDDDFLKLLLAFENNLLLLSQIPKSILTLSDYIHDRTNGYIGAVSNLLREGANLAIQTGEERLNQRLLDQIRLDHAAEQHRDIVRPTRSPPKAKSTFKTEKISAKNEKVDKDNVDVADPVLEALKKAAT